MLSTQFKKKWSLHFLLFQPDSNQNTVTLWFNKILYYRNKYEILLIWNNTIPWKCEFWETHAEQTDYTSHLLLITCKLIRIVRSGEWREGTVTAYYLSHRKMLLFFHNKSFMLKQCRYLMCFAKKPDIQVQSPHNYDLGQTQHFRQLDLNLKAVCSQ